MINQPQFRNERESIILHDKEKMIYILEKFAKQTKLFLKGYSKKTPIRIESIDNGQIKVFLPFDYRVKSKVVIYGITKKYFQIDLKYIRTINIGRHICEPLKTVIATTDRIEQRYSAKDDSLAAVSFKIIKDDDSVLIEKTPLSLSIILKEYEEILSPLFPSLKIRTFESADELCQLVKNTQKILYLRDTQKLESYSIENEELIQYNAHLKNSNYDEVMTDFKWKGVRSLIIYPILYHRHDKEDIPLAYIKIWSKNEILEGPSSLSVINANVHEMIKKFQSALTIHVDIQQKIINISRGGVRLQASSPVLKDHFIKCPELVMDLRFKIKKHFLNLSIRGEVVSSRNDGKGNLDVGLSFIGVEGTGIEKLEKYISLWQGKNIVKNKNPDEDWGF